MSACGAGLYRELAGDEPVLPTIRYRLTGDYGTPVDLSAAHPTTAALCCCRQVRQILILLVTSRAFGWITANARTFPSWLGP